MQGQGTSRAENPRSSQHDTVPSKTHTPLSFARSRSSTVPLPLSMPRTRACHDKAWGTAAAGRKVSHTSEAEHRLLNAPALDGRVLAAVGAGGHLR